MLKKVLLAKSLLVVLAYSNLSYAIVPTQGVYVTGFAGVGSLPKNVTGGPSYHTAYQYGGALGVKGLFLPPAMRLEAEVGAIHANAKKNSGYSLAVPAMGNVYYDFGTHSAFEPFVGGGLGFAYTNLSLPGVIHSSRVLFSYQAMGGGNYYFTPNLAAKVYYRYFGTERNNKANKSFQSHTANLGLTYRFGDSL